jgi:hypothetical protein
VSASGSGPGTSSDRSSKPRGGAGVAGRAARAADAPSTGGLARAGGAAAGAGSTRAGPFTGASAGASRGRRMHTGRRTAAAALRRDMAKGGALRRSSRTVPTPPPVE